MAQINLLPWRENLRDERKRQYLSFIVLVLIGSGALIFVADQYVRRAIDVQTARNEFLIEETRVLEEMVNEISQLQQQKREIQDRMNVIQNLQASRPVIVRVFDELVKTLPEGVYFEMVNRDGSSMKLEGVADSPSGLTTLMRNLDSSEWFSDPVLRIISAADGESAFTDNAANKFELDLSLAPPNEETEADVRNVGGE